MLSSGVRRRSWLAVAALLGLVGSLLSVGVFPAGGVEGEADNEAVYSACVGPALESAGLVDVEGSFAENAVNCLAHFGVTVGRTATTYDPGAPVLRWQMALFLSRAAGPAGVVLPANPADEFTDAAGLPEATRTAINQVAALGIMPGSSGTVFGPGLLVSRAQMAEMLDKFLLEAEKGSGLGLGALGGTADELADVTFDDSFDDIGNVTRGQYSAIRRMYELGVARGTSDDSFSPGAQVTRAQMAVFITRMLAHTTARPAGLTLQAAEPSVEENDPVGLAVSVRGSDLLPIPDAVVDVFSATSPDDAFGADGRCSADDVSVVGGSVACEIAFGDEVAGPSGDVEYSESFTASSTLWAWTGDVGDRYDSDETVSSSVELAVTKPAVKLRVTDDLADNAMAAKFGDRVAITLQLVDEDGNAVSDKDVSVSVASALVTNESGSTGDLPQSSGTTSYKTDASGKIELSFVRTDPRTGSDKRGDVAHLDLDISLSSVNGQPSTLELEDKTALKMAGVEAGALVRNAPPIADAAVVWRDSVATASVLTLTQDVEYHEASATGDGVAHTVRATLTDQYGDPISRRAVEFASDDAAGVGAAPANVDDDPIALRYYDASRLTSMSPDPELNRSGGTRAEDVDPTRGLTGSALRARTKTTNRRGVATLTYTRDSDATGIETIVARVKAELSTSLLAQARNPDHLGYYEDKWDARSGDIMSERIYHYWASEPSKDGSANGRLMVNDAENNRLILVGGNTVSIVEYDDNDQLTATSGAVTLDDFEKDVKDNAKHVSVTAYQTDSRKVSQVTAADEWARLFPFEADDETGDNLLQRFGVSFAADGGVIVVGAPRYQYGEGSTNRRVGRVYVYNSAADTTPAILEMPTADRQANTYFGSLVDISGDTIVVSTRSIGSGRGADKKAYVFVKPSTGGWVSSDAPIVFDESGGNYGKQVAIDGDTIVIGHSGGVRIYERSDTTGWASTLGGTTQIAATATVTISGAVPTPSEHCHSNRCLAVDEDAGTIVLASPRASVTGVTPDPAQGFTGHVHVVSKVGDDWTSTAPTNVKWNAPDEARKLAESRWGQSVAVSGDTIIVSQEDIPNELAKRARVRPVNSVTSTTVAAAPNTGSVYVYTKPDAGWAADTAPTATLSVPVGRGYGAFGTFADISSDGNTIAVSQHHAQQGDWLGAVHVYTKPSSGWANSTAPDEQYTGPTRNGRFGWGTAIDSTSGAIWAALRQDKTGDATVAATGECSSGDVTVGTDTISIKEHCLRYSPVYMIDR